MEKGQIIGSFYFRRTTQGNLIGEFTNNKTDNILTESCDLSNSSVDFVGTYRSSWRQGDEFFKRQLDISRSSNQKFELRWSENGKTEYTGQGFLVNDVLIGHYTN